MNKRDATPEEEEAAIVANCDRWNFCNPGFEINLDAWRAKDQQAKAEGYKAEVCECGTTFLSFHHYIRCDRSDCPLKDGKGSILEQMCKDE